MLCARPYRNGIMEYGCGQCMPCRINKSRVWIARLLLENNEHEQSAFVTLTYRDDSVPISGTLVKKDIQDFLKRLRFYVEPRTIRYYAVGEYGGQTGRPHYHLLIFGLSPTEEEVVKKAWTKGFIYLGTVEQKSVQYVCGYIIKNMRGKHDRRLQGRIPEFSLSSTRPGIGHGAVKRIAGAYQSQAGNCALKDQGWFSGLVRIGKKYPLGRYLKDKIQKELKLDTVSKKAYLRSQMYQMYARKSSTTTTRYERLRKAKVSAQLGRVRTQIQTL